MSDQPTSAPNSSIDVRDPRIHAAIDRYWSANLRVMAVLLGIWAFVGLGCGVLAADVLNHWSLGGFPLGFWFAQQGSIVVFVILILAYCIALNRLDAAHHREMEAIRSAPRADGRNGAAGASIATEPEKRAAGASDAAGRAGSKLS